MKKLILTLALAIIATASIAQEVPKDDDQARADAQARMEAAARQHLAAATQASTNPTTKKAPVYPDVQTILAGLPENLQPKSTGWDNATIAKSRAWIHSHIVGRTVRQQAEMISRTSVKVAGESNPNDILHWEMVLFFKPDKPKLYGFENWINLNSSPASLTMWGKPIVEKLRAATPGQAIVIFVVDNKTAREVEKWNEGDIITFDAEVDDVTITQSKGENPEHGNITISLIRTRPVIPIAK